jgi:hypothetical protein
MEEIEADMLVKLTAEKAAQAAAVAVPGYTPPTRWRMREWSPPSPGPVLSTYQERRRRTEQLKAERAAKEKRTAALLAHVQEQKERREAQEKAAAERKAKGIKLSYEAWKREEWGE